MSTIPPPSPPDELPGEPVPPSERTTVIAPSELAAAAPEPVAAPALHEWTPGDSDVLPPLAEHHYAADAKAIPEMAEAPAPSHEEHHANEKARHVAIAAARANHVANKPRPLKRPPR